MPEEAPVVAWVAVLAVGKAEEVERPEARGVVVEVETTTVTEVVDVVEVVTEVMVVTIVAYGAK